ncbi:MAG: AbrB/MazE/SpoVT family DNA-binding domain-containing protein [Trueperaceae bacterium]|nr:AbrB/MazE/SpoVT family DNA-binding domain-containing protein [Trueperaceae bacterium]
MKGPTVLAKKTSKNQLTLPKEVVNGFPGVDYFAVRAEGGRIILEPFVPSRADQVRQKLADLGIDEQDVTDAVAWARGR